MTPLITGRGSLAALWRAGGSFWLRTPSALKHALAHSLSDYLLTRSRPLGCLRVRDLFAVDQDSEKDTDNYVTAVLWCWAEAAVLLRNAAFNPLKAVECAMVTKLFFPDNSALRYTITCVRDIIWRPRAGFVALSHNTKTVSILHLEIVSRNVLLF